MNKTKLLKLVRALKEPTLDTIPRGWKSRFQLQKEMNVHFATMCLIIKKLKTAHPDKVHVRKFRVKNCVGNVAIVPFYKIDL